MLSKDVLGITCCMETSIIKQYQDEITYLQSLLDANCIPYDYEAYSKAQNKAGQQVIGLMPRIFATSLSSKSSSGHE